jgi:hypothetical protein
MTPCDLKTPQTHPTSMAKSTTMNETRSMQYLFLLIWMCLSPQTTGLSQPQPISRRVVLEGTIISSAALVWGVQPSPALAGGDAAPFSSLLDQIQQARKQLDRVPPLLEKEKWDSVRAVLIEPPLADCWAKTNRNILIKYAEELGDAGGDELAALEAREELVSHLRYLDMAVYNNIFNPIGSEGTSGATKELIRSYFEDPTNEFKASVAALEDLINLSKEL